MTAKAIWPDTYFGMTFITEFFIAVALEAGI
jgi:hypothetical protein